MSKIIKYMTSRKSFPIYVILLSAVLSVFAIKGISKSNIDKSNYMYIGDNLIPKPNNEKPLIVPNKYEKIINNVMLVLKELHYAPKEVNDEFSKMIFTDYLKNLDVSKDLFLQTEVDALDKQYGNMIDDELKLKIKSSFYKSAGDIYKKNLETMIPYVTNLLQQPFDFTVNETINAETEKNTYPKTEAERNDFWRKKIKLMVLERLNDLINQNESAKVKRTQKELEKEAREKVLKTVLRNFDAQKRKATEEEYFKTFMNSVVQSFDPHTEYYPPVDKRTFDEEMSGNYFGIGAQLKEEDGNIKIGPLTYNSPAQKSGELAQGDIIVAVAQGDKEAEDISGYNTREVVKLIRGKENTEVRLTIKKVDGTIKIVKLIRKKLDLDQTFAKSTIINKNGKKFGMIYLPEFYANFDSPTGRRCAMDVAKEIIKLKTEGVEGIVMDLRHNGGGSLQDVINMVGLFIPNGPVVQVKDRIENIKVSSDNDGKSVLWDGPLTVLVNEFSASASEIFAAAIQDHNRGIVIGSTSTFGKGTVQRQITLNFDEKGRPIEEDFGSLKVTMQKFYRINGGSTQLKGVIPDIIVPDVYEHYKFREKDMDYSLQWDEIAKAQYNNDYGLTFTEAIQKSNTRVSTNSFFNGIKTNAKKLDEINDKTYSLNLETYRNERKQIKAINDDIDKVLKGRDSLSTNFIKSDEAMYFIDKDKTETNKRFLDIVSKDVYIHEAINVITDLINKKQIALKQ
jgi:carboxyl-terminal processing protease